MAMSTITVKLDKKRAALLARLARRAKISKSDVIRDLIDHAGPVETADDLIVWIKGSEGKGLRLAQRKR